MLRRDRDNPDLNCRVARCLLDRGRLDDAEHHAATALRADPGSAEACLLLSRISDRRGDTFQAETYFRKAQALDPDIKMEPEVMPEAEISESVEYPIPEPDADSGGAARRAPDDKIDGEKQINGGWYYYIQGEPLGPVTTEELREKINTGVVAAETLVYREEWDEIVTAAAVPELKSLFESDAGKKPVSILGESGVISVYEFLNAPAPEPETHTPPTGEPEDDFPDDAYQDAPKRRKRYRHVQSRMTQSLLAALFFPPFGLVALYFSFRVRQCLKANSRSGAARASRAARAWYSAALVAFAAGIVIVFVAFVFSAFFKSPAHPAP